jgi:hypothetical protein
VIFQLGVPHDTTFNLILNFIVSSLNKIHLGLGQSKLDLRKCPCFYEVGLQVLTQGYLSLRLGPYFHFGLLVFDDTAVKKIEGQ